MQPSASVGTTAGFVLALAIVGTISFVSNANTIRLIATNRELIRIHHTLEQLEATLGDVDECEAARRGYVITGDPKMLEPYTESTATVHRHLNELNHLLSYDPNQLARLQDLRAAVDAKISHLRKSIAMKRGSADSFQNQVAMTVHGLSLMDRVRGLVAQIEVQEKRKLPTLLGEADRRARTTRAVLVAGSAFMLVIVTLSALTSRRAEAARAAARVAVEQEHHRLEARVTERTHELAHANASLHAQIAVREQAEQELRTIRDGLERIVQTRTAELRDRARELARSNEDLERFAYVASHDLQEPLRMVTSYLQLLEAKLRDRLDDESREYFAFGLDGARRMQTMIRDILSYARVGAGTQQLARVDSAKSLRTVLADMHEALCAAGATVTSGRLPAVLADEEQLGQVFDNLLRNAIKFASAAPPRVRVSAKRAGAMWEFSIRDNGIGVPPEFAERIFVMFQRLHPRSEYGGTGIGLAICKRVVERHGGRIWVEAAPRGGSVFRFTLPGADTAE